MSSHTESLRKAIHAVKQGHLIEAIALLEAILSDAQSVAPATLSQAQMTLVKAYQQSGQLEAAIALCQQLTTQGDLQVQDWAQQALPALLKAQEISLEEDVPIIDEPEELQPLPKAGRAVAGAVAKLSLVKTAANLTLASSVTLLALFGMVLSVTLAVFLIMVGDHPLLGLGISVGIAIAFNAVVFFLAPLLMDLIQNWLYHTRWVSLADLKRMSPESAQLIQRVCQQHRITEPRLGIIDDQNPTAFTYGSLPNTARLVVSKGLFTYLDEDEVAAVYAHEMGHIVHWDFAVMTLGATLVQLLYLVYSFARRMSRGKGDNKIKDALGQAAIAAYVFHFIGTYMLQYLSRTREYYADHFSAETTGNPNGLSRALVKIAYGILEEGKRTQEPSRLIEGTRALGIYDPKAAASTGTAYRIASTPDKVGRVFLWDLFNPWAWWIELSSTHPLTGKRIRALSTYAEQLGLEMEFDMGRIIGEGKQLNQKRLRQNFVMDLSLYVLPWVGVSLGLMLAIISMIGVAVGGKPFWGGISLALIVFGISTLIQMVFMFPDFDQAPATDVLTLMSNPYASPLRGQPVKLQGELIGRGDAGSKLGSDLKLQDRVGMIYLHYSSRFGPIGNALFGYSQVKTLLGEQVNATGWFRRGSMPWVDLALLQTPSGRRVDSYHRFWSVILGGGAVLLGLALPVFMG
jgi:Zn-dependent protease with chaperone function